MSAPTPLLPPRSIRGYVGQTRGGVLPALFTAAGVGEMTVRGQLPARRSPWAFDNGAFGDWQKKADFHKGKYVRDLDTIDDLTNPPDFVVAPDVVAGGLDSLRFSVQWTEAVVGWPRPAPIYLAVQDGMTERDVRPHLWLFDGLFVGGSLEWKLETAPQWVRFAHESGGRCHIGRMGTAPRVRWAREIGADSIDSCTPLWSEDNARRFINALSDPYTPGLFEPMAPAPRTSWGQK